MVFKLPFLLFTLVLAYVSTHNLRKNGKSLTTPTFLNIDNPGLNEEGWIEYFNNMNDGSQLKLWINLWEEVKNPTRNKILNKFLENANRDQRPQIKRVIREGGAQAFIRDIFDSLSGKPDGILRDVLDRSLLRWTRQFKNMDHKTQENILFEVTRNLKQWCVVLNSFNARG
eukprot:GHVL01039243.1.p1 GENE.GHVL01039243.1~~GHVL01039243.1.p1  ORF type:complete len:171 (+),score=22.49 GHVL01039243.1:55-567(+)